MSICKARTVAAGFLLLFLFTSVSVLTAQIHAVRIGKLVYVGSAVKNDHVESSYEVQLDTTGITEEPITFSNVILIVKGSRLSTQRSGFPIITTGPGCDAQGGPACKLLFRGGHGLTLAPCADKRLTQTCVSIAAQFVSLTGKNFSFALANHEQFCTHGINNVFLTAQQGKAALDPQCDAQGFCKGASVPIVLRAAPAKSCTP